jgi:cysteine-rich repeat protein
VRVPTCGDGILDAGETCDDGNLVNGDCCSSLCQVEALASPCADDGDPCTLDECDGAGNCGVGAPRSGCRTALKSLLAIKNNADDAKDKLIWKWLKGEATTQGELRHADRHHRLHPVPVRWHDVGGAGQRRHSAGGELGADQRQGYKFKDKTGTPEGIQKVVLKGGAAGKAKALVKGKGANLPDVLTGVLPLPVTAQLVNDANAVCFEGQYDSADVKKNDGTQFKAKAQ